MSQANWLAKRKTNSPILYTVIVGVITPFGAGLIVFLLSEVLKSRQAANPFVLLGFAPYLIGIQLISALIISAVLLRRNRIKNWFAISLFGISTASVVGQTGQLISYNYLYILILTAAISGVLYAGFYALFNILRFNWIVRLILAILLSTILIFVAIRTISTIANNRQKSHDISQNTRITFQIMKPTTLPAEFHKNGARVQLDTDKVPYVFYDYIKNTPDGSNAEIGFYEYMQNGKYNPPNDCGPVKPSEQEIFTTPIQCSLLTNIGDVSVYQVDKSNIYSSVNGYFDYYFQIGNVIYSLENSNNRMTTDDLNNFISSLVPVSVNSL